MLLATQQYGLKGFVAIAVCVGLMVGEPRAIVARAFTFCSPNQQEQAQEKSAFKEFARRIDQYQKLRSKLEHSLPRLKPSGDPQILLAREQALAQKIVDARKDAKRGDIFTDEISTEFRKLIRRAFSGTQGRELYKTMNQGEPLDVTLRVNQVYPATMPVTTVPPTILQQLPRLPPSLEYRIVNRDMVLEDVQARLVVDFMTEAYPRPSQ